MCMCDDDVVENASSSTTLSSRGGRRARTVEGGGDGNDGAGVVAPNIGDFFCVGRVGIALHHNRGSETIEGRFQAFSVVEAVTDAIPYL